MIFSHLLHQHLSRTLHFLLKLATAIVFAFFYLLDALLFPLYSVLDLILPSRTGAARWSDCGCQQCATWMHHRKLHVVVKAPPSSTSSQHVIFLHGFLYSSSFWTQTIFPHLSPPDCTLHAVDLLGFGQSGKPYDCDYTVEDHVNAVKESVIDSNALTSFHLVAHSMGCIIAVALAEKFPERVRSITLVAPPIFPSSEVDVLQKIARKRLWPPLLFGIAFMSWYENLGRCVCLCFCKNHRAWEGIVKLLFSRKENRDRVEDMTRHTHHSAWHSMHNVVCGGHKYLDDWLRTLAAYKVKICVINGRNDELVPLQCAQYIQKMVPHAALFIIDDAKHDTVVIGREKELVCQLMSVIHN